MLSIDPQLPLSGPQSTAPDIDCASSVSSSVSTSHKSSCLSHQSEGSDSSEIEIDKFALSLDPVSSYSVGRTFTAFRHEPPGPFGRRYKTNIPATLENWRTLSKKEHCCTRIPIRGRLSYDVRKALTITAIVRTGHSNGAQLVVVNDCMVAKIFDPLCYNDECEFGFPQDVVTLADGDYSREAAAYKEIQKSPAAKEITPAFYGTWIIETDTPLSKDGHVQNYTRRVPLILMEHIRGICMRNINPHSLPEEQRSLILKKVLEAELILYHAGVNHGDLSPRNIMVLGMNCDDKVDATDTLTVKIIDFNVALILRYIRLGSVSESENLSALWYPKMVNPIFRYFRRLGNFSISGWCPLDKKVAPDLWLWEQFHDDERYIPVCWDPANPKTKPKYIDFHSASENRVDPGLGHDIEVEKKEQEVSGRKDSGQAKD